MSNMTTMNQASLAALNNALADMEKAGQIKIAELLPSLNGVLTDPEQGGFAGKAFLGEVRSYTRDVQMPSTLGGKEDTHLVDQLEVRDVTGDYAGTSFAFNAANAGLKAKLRKLEGAKIVFIVYRGEMEPTQKGFNPAKDFGMMEVMDLSAGKAVYATAKSLYPKTGK